MVRNKTYKEAQNALSSETFFRARTQICRKLWKRLHFAFQKLFWEIFFGLFLPLGLTIGQGLGLSNSTSCRPEALQRFCCFSEVKALFSCLTRFV